MLNEAEKIVEKIMDDQKLATHSQVAAFLGIAASTLHGLISRNSIKTLKKHLRLKDISFESLEKEDEEKKKFSDRFKQHMLENPPSKTFDKVQKLLELQDQHAPYSSPYSSLFQILFGLSKDEILRILSEKLELENASDEDKIRFIEDFEALLQHIVSSQTKLEILDRVRKKVLK